MSTQPRKERKTLYNLPNHLAQRQVSAHLSGDLIKRYNRRSLTVRKGDTVLVMRGDFAGTAGKVIEVVTRDRKIIVENVTVEKADHTKKPRPVDPSNVLVTKLDLTDKFRRSKLGSAAEADAKEQEREAEAARKKEEAAKKAAEAAKKEEAAKKAAEAAKKAEAAKAAKAAAAAAAAPAETPEGASEEEKKEESA